MEKKESVYAIIVTYNAMKWLAHCLNSLKKSTHPMNIVIVDNHSSDGTVDFIKQNYGNKVLLFPQKKNRGFGQANNIGIKYALSQNADYVLLINQDAYLDSFAIERMLKECDQKSLLSPVHLNGDGTKLDKMFEVSMKLSNNEMLDDVFVLGKLKQRYETGEICAACWLMPIALIKTIGGFNPLFFHYGEDNNYYQRLVFHKIKTILVTGARVFHDRELYGNVSAFNNKKLRRDILLELTNINHSIARRFMKTLKVLLHCYLKDLPNQSYKIGAFTREMCWVLFHVHAIRKSIVLEKNVGESWL